MPQYQVALVISPAKGCLGLLFSPTGRLTKGILEIEPDIRTVKIYGTDLAVSMVEYNLTFGDIQEIKGLGPMIMKIILKDRREIQLKNIDTLVEILDLLSQYVPDTTHELVRRRIEKFEKRLWKS
jgi:hypothetical protein